MEGPRDDAAARVNEWVNVVRRARIGASAKLVALALASYANRDGARIFPGLVRLSVQCELSYSATQRGLRRLRQVGLLAKTRRGARRSGNSDQYRLVLAPDLIDRVDVPTPEQEQAEIDAIKAHRAKLQASRVTPRTGGH